MQAEGSPQESGTRFRLIFEHAQMGIALIKPDGRFLEVNPAFCAMLGFSPTELLAMAVEDITHPDNFPETHRVFEEVIAGKRQTAKCEKRYIRKDKTVAWGSTTAALVSDERREPLYLVCLVQDITERKQAEVALRESEEKYRLLVDSAHEVFIAVDADGSIIDWNLQAEATFGWSREQVMGRTLSKTIVPEQFRQAHERGLKHFLATGEGPVLNRRIEVIGLHRDGHEFPLEMTITPVRWGESYIFSAFMHDITERKQAEEALRQSQQNYAALVDSIEGIVWEAEAKTLRFLFVSRKAERLLGYPIERWLNVPYFWRDHIHPNDRDWAVDFCMRTTREKRDHEFQYRMIAADGRIVWLHDVVTVVVENDEPERLRGVMVDITERKRAEEALQQNHALLQGIIEGTTDAAFVKDTRGRYLMINSAGARFVGKSVAEVIGQDDTTLFSPETARAIKERDKEIMAAGAPQTFEEVVAAAGGMRTFLTTKSPYRDAQGNIIGVIGIGRDVTEFKRLEDQLQDGHQVMEARNGLEALAMSRGYSGSIHLLLTDVVMPKLNGPELARRLTKERPTLSVLFMSGYSDNAILYQQANHHRVPVLAKPFTPTSLSQMVREVLCQ